MKLFTDQMIAMDVIDSLREAGFDVECTAEKGMSRSDDLEILKYCTDNQRILVTLDEHFGDWTVIKLNKHPGVIRLKVNLANSLMIKDALLPFLKQNIDRQFRNYLVIVKETRVRWIRTA